MFYETSVNNHGLNHDPFKAIVSPRPIGWIGSKGSDGTLNLAPYSFFNAISDHPKMVLFSSSGWKDSVRNIKETGVFTTSLVSRTLAEKMNMTSASLPYGESEFAKAGLTAQIGRMVDAPYVGEALAALECVAVKVEQLQDRHGSKIDSFIVIGEVLGIHIDESIIRNGRIDNQIARLVARMGYMDYCEASDVFEMMRPRL